ncbi:MAG: nucleotidyl transferase AbiEii/AbiGii toxin family protein [Bacteroidales bacterium]|jgi:predicted nucleotidyltransferase component of viral defense system|nr:nucleotidyl transferase AbiEii/AbiGii toxin family protein [Bacteroidales bacterium]
MIEQSYIEEWRLKHPWTNPQVEQDLVISRAIVEIFSDDLLQKSLAFRGGTALHKLYITPQARYSEDIDLVQINSEPINPVLKRIRERLNFLGTKRTVKQHVHNNTMIYRFDSEIHPIVNMRLKIEINTREHLNIFGVQEVPYKVENEWFSGECNVTGFEIEELLGSKLKALYGRKKGRDLFDLYWAFTHLNIDIEKLFFCNKKHYENAEQKQPTNRQFLRNMEEKLKDVEFTNDIFQVIKSDIEYDNDIAWKKVRKELKIEYND